MGLQVIRSVSLLVVLLLTGFAITTPAQIPRIPGITKGKDKDDDAKLREKEKARATRDAGRYDRLKAFSMNLYQTDPDFRDDVDQLFDEVQRAHSLQAFEKNVAPPARPTVVHDGDRLRLQTGLYDNKLVADYLNRVGQRLVPSDSEKLSPYRRTIALFLVFILVAALLALVPPLVVRQILDHAIPDSDRTQIWWLAGLAVVAALLDALLQIGQRWCSARVGEGLIADLRRALFAKVQRLPLAFFTRTPTGAITSRLNNDVVGAQTAVTSTLGSVVSNVVVLVTTLITMLAGSSGG